MVLPSKNQSTIVGNESNMKNRLFYLFVSIVYCTINQCQIKVYTKEGSEIEGFNMHIKLTNIIIQSLGGYISE